METPKILLKKADEITEKLKVKYPELAPFSKTVFSTLLKLPLQSLTTAVISLLRVISLQCG